MLALTACVGQPVLDADARRVGRVVDLGADARSDVDGLEVSSVVVRRARRAAPFAIPWDRVAAFETAGVTLGGTGNPVPDRPGPALRLVRDVLDAQIVDVAGARVVRVADVLLERRGAGLRVVAVDVGPAALLRRLGLRRLTASMEPRAIAWDALHPASGRAHALALATPGAAVHRLRGAELAHLAAALPPARGAEVLRSVGARRAAGALAAAHPETSAGLLATLGPEAAGPVVAAMPADDAVAALRGVEAHARADVLAELPSARAAELARLLAHPAGSVAGLMSTDVLTAREDEPPEALLARLRAGPPRLEGLATTFLLDPAGRPTGALSALDLLAGRPPSAAVAVAADAPVDAVLDVFARRDVLAVAVVDGAGRLIGAVAIDDVLEELLAERLPATRHGRIAAIRRRHAA
jgi:CBS domain-containing protein